MWTTKIKVDSLLVEERHHCIQIAILSYKELGIERDELIRLLQKYWDLQESEAEAMV